MTAAPLSWHRARTQQLVGEAALTSADDAAAAPRLSLTGRHGGSGEQVDRHRRRGGGHTSAAADTLGASGAPECQRDSLMLFMFATKMATESAVAEILWLTSGACASQARCAARQRRPLAMRAYCRQRRTAAVSPCGRGVSLLHCRRCLAGASKQPQLMQCLTCLTAKTFFLTFIYLHSTFTAYISIQKNSCSCKVHIT